MAKLKHMSIQNSFMVKAVRPTLNIGATFSKTIDGHIDLYPGFPASAHSWTEAAKNPKKIFLAEPWDHFFLVSGYLTHIICKWRHTTICGACLQKK